MKQHILKNKALKLYKSGLSTRKVATKLGVGFATIYRWCKEIIRNKSESLQKEKHPLYKGGSIDVYGYHVLWEKRKLIRKHRLVMNLPKGMIVHHINGNKLDNRKENLQVMTRGEHTRLHNLERRNHAPAHYS